MKYEFRNFDWNGTPLKDMTNEHLNNAVNWAYNQITIHFVENGLIDYKENIQDNDDIFNHYVIEAFIMFTKESIYRTFFNIIK